MEESIKGNKCERERTIIIVHTYIDHITVGRSCQTTSPNLEPQLRAKNVHIKRVKNISVLNFILCVFLEATKQARNRNRIRKKDQRTNWQTDRQPDRQMERRTDRQTTSQVSSTVKRKEIRLEREREKRRLPMAGRVRKVSYLWDSLFFLRKLSKLEPVVKT